MPRAASTPFGVTFGGHDGERVFGDTWEYTGDGWHPRAETEPRLRLNNGH